MYSVDEIIEQIDHDSDIENNSDVEGGNEDNGEGNEDGTKEDETTDADTTKVQPKVKRKQGTRPKLDAERLKGPRGLICMEKMFSDLKFKGHGHEKQDLNQVMNMLQYWCHRLFPKFTFDDCLAQLERLGTKKPVMTLKKKILYDMMEEDPNPIDPDNLQDDVTESQQEAINEFDLLLNQEPIPTSITSTQPAVTAEVVKLTETQKEMIERNRQLATERRRARLEAMKQKELENSEAELTQDSQAQSQTLNLTEEQRSIIEKNRLLAIERRKRLQNKLNTSLELSQNTEDLLTSNSEQEVEDNTEKPTTIETEMQVDNNEDNLIPNSVSKEKESISNSEEKELRVESEIQEVVSGNTNENGSPNPTAKVDLNIEKFTEQENLSEELRTEVVSENTEQENLSEVGNELEMETDMPKNTEQLSEMDVDPVLE